jgi:polar amino acid transport system permease protein
MSFDWAIIWQYRDALAQGVLMTVLLAATTMLVAIPGGIVLALMRVSKLRPIAAASACFVEFFRNVPLILLVYWAYYVMPVAIGVEFSAFTTGLVALSLNVSAYNAETFRSGIGSIRKGQTEAALALGMSHWQVMRQIVLPQATSRVLPVLASTWVSLFKDTSLVSVIGVGELSYISLQVRAQTFRILEMLTAMAGIYWLLGFPQAKLVDWIHRRYGAAE